MLDAKELAGLLNKLFAADPVAAAELVGHRVECNKSFLGSDVPFVCSQSSDAVITLGVVGFINAMAKPGTGRAAAVYDDNNSLTGFVVVGGNDAEPWQHEDYAL